MYFSNAKVGDRVWDYVYDSGTIRQVDKQIIHVVFDSGTILEIDYSKDGREYSGENNQRLFYYESRPIVITQDDLDISENCHKYRLDQYGIHEVYEHKMFGLHGYSELHFKDKKKEYNRKVHRENDELSIEQIEELYELCEKLKIKPITIDGKDYYELYSKETALYFRKCDETPKKQTCHACGRKL